MAGLQKTFMTANRRRQIRLVWIAALGAIALGGCARGRLMQAGTLPSEYLVAHVDNAQTIDLSKLATSSASNELIDCGDLLTVTVDSGFEGDRENAATTIRVGEDGNVQVPLVGSMSVAGIELTAAEQVIRNAAIERGVFRNPNVTVEMKQARVNRVTVLGAVSVPGTYQLPRASSSLLAAIVQAHGLSADAGTDIEIRRPALRSEAVPVDQEPSVAAGGNQLAGFAKPHATLRPTSSTRINLISATKESAGSPEYYLDDGDVVMVEKRDPLPVHVIGLVTKPGQIRLPANQDLHLLDAIALAGGQATPYVNKVHLLRRVPGSEQPLVVEISLREAKSTGKGNMLLGPGDVVSVEQSPANFAMEMFKSIVPYAVSPALTATLLR
ncbi:MAG TPA: polysaccharide biosynthesis/export family protein [Pirellulales bacterium]|nr:polysaccharide biosynthesis/export family protein [Pirellulales bacterium]